MIPLVDVCGSETEMSGKERYLGCGKRGHVHCLFRMYEIYVKDGGMSCAVFNPSFNDTTHSKEENKSLMAEQQPLSRVVMWK